MSFLGNLVNEFTHQGQPQGQSYAQGPYQQQQSSNGPPQVPPPWIAEWDAPANRWIYINRETGQRTFEYPQPYGGYGGGSYGGGYGSQGGYEQRGGYNEQPPPPPQSHTGRNVALGAAAGVIGGALLMHEGEKVEERWDEDKYRIENDISNDVQDVEDVPEDAARWTGRKVQEVEDIPQDIENRWDNAVQDVEDVPEDVAGWAGQRVGDVERFDDNVDNAYDQGRDDARYDDY